MGNPLMNWRALPTGADFRRAARAVLTSAGTLYPFMREKIATVFGCEVYNLYGSREVSYIACELPGRQRLWRRPGGNFVEIVDEAGDPCRRTRKVTSL